MNKIQVVMTSKSDLSLTTHAESSFDPALYASLFYSGHFQDTTEKKFSAWILQQFHDIFSEGTFKGEQLLDIGTGPVVHPIVTASKWFDKIYLSDYSKSNIEFLEKWRRGESLHMKFLMESIAQNEEQSVSWESLNKQVLDKVQAVVECDVNKPNPLSGTVLEDAIFDVVTSCLCLQVAALTIEDYEKALRNISTLLKPGGHLAVVDFLDQTYYEVGAKKFQALSLTVEELQRAIKDSGYVIERWNTWSFSLDYEVGNGNTLYSMVAKKQI